MDFTFLHISDIHFDDQTTNQAAAQREILNKIDSEKIRADCLIISGDLFNKGLLTSRNAGKLIEFIKKFPGASHIYVVPGNHDLNRFASKEEDGYNQVLRRAELVNKYKKILEQENKEFTIEREEEPVIYEGSFGAFQRFCAELGARAPFAEDSSEMSNYEVKIASQSKDGIEVRFVLLNTALISGQSVKGEEFRSRESAIEKRYNDAIQSQQPLSAAKEMVDLEQLRDRFRRDGELIVDEEKRDPGTQSLSYAGDEILNSIKVEHEDITIFVGHHGWEYLAKETREALKKAMENSERAIYLCGHAHQESAQNIQTQVNIPILQFQAGVLFRLEDGYTQYGFNYGTISANAGKIECDVQMWKLIRAPSGNKQWISEPLHQSWTEFTRAEESGRANINTGWCEEDNKRNVEFENNKGVKN